MKNHLTLIAVCLAVFLFLSVLCYGELRSFNILRSGLGLLTVSIKEDAVVQIADYPTPVYLVSTENGYAVFKAWLEKEGYELLEHEQMGSQFQVERDGIREYVYWSANGYFQKWVWDSQ